MEIKMNQDGIWVTILEYAHIKKTSISTIRRSIKSGHVKYKEENGKYLIWTKSSLPKLDEEKIELGHKLEIEFLKRENQKLIEEINDLKMLLSVYENQDTYTINLPPIPEIQS
jgi:cell division protein FtsB